MNCNLSVIGRLVHVAKVGEKTPFLSTLVNVTKVNSPLSQD